ncbi:MAG: LysR family transcriptional regulator [Hydrogenophaga sp.]|uniref:LysR family transcriptional regulator n=1 Tax=Hydrogenophaga sp. TaxID=1904254 RepID=UPI0025BA03E8|nr:LysR family transcriptional regulator [Hydrogenophaga sp.]MBT9550612.1 LysR family transcriptional regulator [Hydrogenophaga sp.]
MNLSFRQLQAFVHASQCGSFSAAADLMGVSQPALSQLIRQMEDELGLPLFHRTTRRISLTVAGREILGKAQRTVRQMEDLSRHAEDLHAGLQGTLTIAVIASVACSLFPLVLAQFDRLCPGVALVFQEEPASLLLERVRHGDVELGWGLYPTAHEELVFEPLGRDQMVAAIHADHPLALRESVTWRALRQHKVISASRQSGVRIYSDRAAQAAGVEIRPSYQTGSLSTAIALVRNGVGCAVLPALALDGMNLSDIVVRPMEKPGVWREIGLVQRRGWPLSPSASLFAGLIRQVSRPTGRTEVPVTQGAAVSASPSSDQADGFASPCR